MLCLQEVNEATARAEAAIRIETAIQNQKVIKQQTLQKVEEAEGANYVIRDGIVVIPKDSVIPDGTVI